MDADFPPGMLDEWREIFADKLEHDTLGDATLIPAVFRRSRTMPLQRQRELAAMMSIARQAAPVTVMEIGADKAGTLLHWIVCHPGVRRVIACEIRGTPYRELFESRFRGVSFLWLEESSYTPAAVAKVKAFLGSEPLDVVFIDGDKGAFRQDFDCYAPLVRPGGMVFMHDVYDRSGSSVCARAFRELAKSRPASTIIDITESVQAKQRAQAGVPSADCHEDWLRASGDDCGFGVIYI